MLTEAVEYALDIDVIDADIRTIVEHRADRPVEMFSLDGDAPTAISLMPKGVGFVARLS